MDHDAILSKRVVTNFNGIKSVTLYKLKEPTFSWEMFIKLCRWADIYHHPDMKYHDYYPTIISIAVKNNCKRKIFENLLLNPRYYF